MEITDREIRLMTGISRSLASSFDVRPDDVFQVMAEWMLTHEAKVEEFRNGKRGLRTTLAREGLRYCKAERAYLDGYDPADQLAYSRREIRERLPYALAADPWPPGRGVPEFTTSTGDMSRTGDHQVSLYDLREAFEALDPIFRYRLRHAVDVGFDYDLLGEMWVSDDDNETPIGASAAEARVGYYIDKMRRHLNKDHWPQGKQVESDADAERFYRMQLRGLEDWAGQRDRPTARDIHNQYNSYVYGG